MPFQKPSFSSWFDANWLYSGCSLSLRQERLAGVGLWRLFFPSQVCIFEPGVHHLLRCFPPLLSLTLIVLHPPKRRHGNKPTVLFLRIKLLKSSCFPCSFVPYHPPPSLPQQCRLQQSIVSVSVLCLPTRSPRRRRCRQRPSPRSSKHSHSHSLW